MTLAEVRALLSAEVICGQDKLNLPVESACAGDLLSDLLAFSHNKTLLLTGLNNSQVIRTAEIIDLAAIIFVRGKRPHGEMIQLAEEKGIPLLVTRMPLYESCGILYSAGLREEKIS
ncbi:MAG: DRTGG domain-containing protein [Bacillota bacterium]|nr:DRTGG domain-containing protein [Bacillota bacterium]